MAGMIASPYAEQLARIPVSAHRTDVDGTETAWWEYGEADAPVLVLVHGFRGDHHGLEPVVAQLPGLPHHLARPAGIRRVGDVRRGRPHDIDAYADWLGAFIRAIGIDGPYDAARPLVRLDRRRRPPSPAGSRPSASCS